MIADQFVHEELERRINLSIAVDTVIEQHFCLAPGRRMKRGAVQEFIMASLNLNRENAVCKLINERMAKAGFWPYILKGTLYYKNLKLI